MVPVEFTSRAQKDLSQLEKQIAQRILKKIRWLSENFETVTPEPLTGQWQGVYKLRVGNYRVLYSIQQPEQAIIVHLIKHRREVYK